VGEAVGKAVGNGTEVGFSVTAAVGWQALINKTLSARPLKRLQTFFDMFFFFSEIVRNRPIIYLWKARLHWIRI
jgi:hypothetical protein